MKIVHSDLSEKDTFRRDRVKLENKKCSKKCKNDFSVEQILFWKIRKNSKYILNIKTVLCYDMY